MEAAAAGDVAAGSCGCDSAALVGARTAVSSIVVVSDADSEVEVDVEVDLALGLVVVVVVSSSSSLGRRVL